MQDILTWFYLACKKKLQTHIEVDFYLPEINVLVQSCYSLSDVETRKREIDALEKAMKHLECNKAYIITFDESTEIQTAHGPIKVLPLWEMALQGIDW